MLTIVQKPRALEVTGAAAPLRYVRPSLLDLRFTGDPWVVDHKDGTASVRLDNYRLARIQTMPFDLPSLNQLWMQLRQWQVRRCYYRRLHTKRAGSGSDVMAVAPASGSYTPRGLI
jgi:hypothetical protein